LGEEISNAIDPAKIHEFESQLSKAEFELDLIIKPQTDKLLESIENFTNEFSATNPQGFVIPVSVEIPPEARNHMDEQLDEMSERFRAFGESVAQILTDGIGNALTGLGQDLGDLVSGQTNELKDRANQIREQIAATSSESVDELNRLKQELTSVEDQIPTFGDKIIRALADFAGQFGKLLILTGLGKIAFEKLKFPGAGVLLVAAGVALTAAAQAVNAQLSRATGALSGAGGGSSGGGTARTPDFRAERAGEQIILVGGEFKVRGGDLVLALDNTMQKKQRTG
jgi:gas vesicle protein